MYSNVLTIMFLVGFQNKCHFKVIDRQNTTEISRTHLCKKKDLGKFSPIFLILDILPWFLVGQALISKFLRNQKT